MLDSLSILLVQILRIFIFTSHHNPGNSSIVRKVLVSHCRSLVRSFLICEVSHCVWDDVLWNVRTCRRVSYQVPGMLFQSTGALSKYKYAASILYWQYYTAPVPSRTVPSLSCHIIRQET